MTTPVFVRLLHGRNDPDEQLDDWGFDGPTLGPFVAVHFTYFCDIRCIAENHDEVELKRRDDMIKHDGKFYGDFEIATGWDS